MSECGAVGKDMFWAQTGFVLRKFRCKQERKVAHEVMAITGDLMSFKMVELGKVRVLCNQSLRESNKKKKKVSPWNLI
jgi:hypothetical protein